MGDWTFFGLTGYLQTYQHLWTPYVDSALAWPGLLAALVLSFARAVGEFGATITFVSSIPGETQTLPLAIYALTQTPGGDAAALRLCVLSVVLSLAALLLSEVLVRRASRRMLGYDAVGRD